MKAMSKLFLIIAGALIVVGAVLMIIGGSNAKKQGILLFPEKVDGKYVYTVDLEDKDIEKFTIDATDADVKVVTGEQKDYVEFINFNENYYSISTTNKMVSFEERVSLSTLFSFWDGSYTFKGMRNLLNLGGRVEGRKEVIIHLKDTSQINIFSFTITDGDITVNNADSGTDYLIAMNSGNVVMNNVKSTSKLMINGNDCKVSLKSCEFRSFASDIDNVDLTAEMKGVHSFEFTGKTGKFKAAIEADMPEHEIRINSDNPITFNSQIFNGSYTDNNKPANSQDCVIMHVDGESIDVTVDLTLPDITDTEDTEAQ
ncbi:MAG: hypothetical protein IKP68_02280 [Clostridia bacterium]|nr:hypothetical protein [Clostridia bacterium]